MLGLRPGTNEEMMDKIIKFLLCPRQKDIEEYITGDFFILLMKYICLGLL